jgi:hypothetical protein
MKKEFGKWLMDIAKYLTTAVLLASVFSDLDEKWIIYVIVTISIALSLGVGLWLLKEPNKKEV